MTAPILTIADEIKSELNENDFSESFTASRNYVEFHRLEDITTLEVWVQPVEEIITPVSRDQDQNEYFFEVGIFKRCATTAEIDSMINLADEIYRYFRRFEFTGGGKQVSVESPTLYSPEYLMQAGLFASVIRLKVVETR